MINYVFLANGFEEIEAMTTIDILRRAGMDVITVSINQTNEVKGAHGVIVIADELIDYFTFEREDWLILPGGMPGATNLRDCDTLCKALVSHNEYNGNIAAICASPSVVLATLGLLDNRSATCYPGMENNDHNIIWKDSMVVSDNNIITGRGPAAASQFALTIVSHALNDAISSEVAAGMLL